MKILTSQVFLASKKIQFYITLRKALANSKEKK